MINRTKLLQEFIHNDTMYLYGFGRLMPHEFKHAPLVYNAILHEYRPWKLPPDSLSMQVPL